MTASRATVTAPTRSSGRSLRATASRTAFSACVRMASGTLSLESATTNTLMASVSRTMLGRATAMVRQTSTKMRSAKPPHDFQRPSTGTLRHDIHQNGNASAKIARAQGCSKVTIMVTDAPRYPTGLHSESSGATKILECPESNTNASLPRTPIAQGKRSAFSPLSTERTRSPSIT